MLSPTLIVLILLALGAGIVIWAVRRKPDQPPAGSRQCPASPRGSISRWACRMK